MPTDLSVIDAAALIGVSRARVYQRVTGQPIHQAGRPLDGLLRPARRPGLKKDQLHLRVPLHAVLTWRAERVLAHEPVGDLPETLADAFATVLAQVRAAQAAPASPPAVIGFPMFRPF